MRKKVHDIRNTLPQGVAPGFNDEFGDTYGTVYGATADGFTDRELRVHSGSCCYLTKLSHHQANGGPAEEGKTVAVEALPVLGERAVAIKPGDGPLDDPAFWRHHECVEITALDDLQ